ncbi:MAG: hypothetical protein KatS3mg105_1259 [Gemmatales bacterium]|nr:MAG: hypothetical protein KatS3mg105_1259 [Gemmatales bacterium]
MDPATNEGNRAAGTSVAADEHWQYACDRSRLVPDTQVHRSPSLW